jgi:hypothetical protein
MLQWLYMYILSFCSQCSVFSDVCCKCVILDVVYVSYICCKRFIWMLGMFYNDFEVSVSDACSCVSSVLRRMMLHLDVLKVDWVLHLAPASPSAASSRCLHHHSAPAEHPNQRRRRAPPPVGCRRDGGQAAASTRGRALLLFRYVGEG